MNSETQSNQKKKKVVFEHELRDYRQKESSKIGSSYDPMMEKLKQWKKEKEMKQQSQISNNQRIESTNSSQLKLMQKKPFENSLRSYQKPSHSPINSGKSRLKSSLQHFYDRFNQNSNKNMNSSLYLPSSLNRSTIFSFGGNNISHKKGYYSENNSICPSIDKNNIDFIDQIEDRIEFLYYDYMDGKIIDRQQMRKEIIDILNLCKIKIIKGLMVGGIEQVKLNQQLWYIFLLNFDFKQMWKNNALTFIKENNIMQEDHLILAEQNIKIIPDDQNKSVKEVKQEEIETAEESLVNENNYFKQQEFDNLKYEESNIEQDQTNQQGFEVQNLQNTKQFTLESIKEENHAEFTRENVMIDESIQIKIDENVKQNYDMVDENNCVNETEVNQIKFEQQSQLRNEQNEQIEQNIQTSSIENQNEMKEENKSILKQNEVQLQNSPKICKLNQSKIKTEYELEKEKQNFMQSQNIFQKFEFLQAEIANSYTKAQRIINKTQSKVEKMSENKQDIIDMNCTSIYQETPQLNGSYINSDNQLKSITKRLDYQINLDNNQPLFDCSPWKEMKIQNEQKDNCNQNIFEKTEKSIFDPSSNKPNDNSQIKQLKEKIFKFSFGNTLPLTPEQIDSRIQVTTLQNLNEQEGQSSEINKENIPIQRQLFEDNYNLRQEEPNVNKLIDSQSILENSCTQDGTNNYQNQSNIFKEIKYNYEEKDMNSSQIKHLLKETNKDLLQKLDCNSPKIGLENNSSFHLKFDQLNNRDKENVQFLEQNQSQIYTLNSQNSQLRKEYNKSNDEINRKQRRSSIRIKNEQQYSWPNKEQFVHQLIQEELQNPENIIKKRILNEFGLQQNFQQIKNCNQYQNNSNNQNLSEQLPIVLQNLQNQQKIDMNEYSFNFNKLTDHQKQDHQQFNIFNLSNNTDSLIQYNNNDQQNTCNFNIITHNLVNITNNNIFEQKNQPNFTNNSPFHPISQLTNNDYIFQQQKQQQTIEEESQQNQINQNELSNQNYFNLPISNNLNTANSINCDLQNINQINHNQNGNIITQKSNIYINTDITNEFENILFTQQEKPQQLQLRKSMNNSSKKRRYIFSPTVTSSKKISIQNSNDLLIQSLSKSKRKSILGLDIQDIISVQVCEDFGHQYIQSYVPTNSIQKNLIEDEDNNLVQWVRRSLRISKKKSNIKKNNPISPTNSSNDSPSSSNKIEGENTNYQSPPSRNYKRKNISSKSKY